MTPAAVSPFSSSVRLGFALATAACGDSPAPPQDAVQDAAGDAMGATRPPTPDSPSPRPSTPDASPPTAPVLGWHRVPTTLPVAVSNNAVAAVDDQGTTTIAVMPIPNDGLGAAINDRLARAAAPRT